MNSVMCVILIVLIIHYFGELAGLIAFIFLILIDINRGLEHAVYL